MKINLPFPFKSWKASQKTQKNSLVKSDTVLKLYGLETLNHLTYYSTLIAETMAEYLTPKELDIILENENLKNDIVSFLRKKDFFEKNWINEETLSLQGISAFLISSFENQINFQIVKLIDYSYDINGKLILVKFSYIDTFEKNSQVFQLIETYKLKGKQVLISRELYELKKEKNLVLKDKVNFEKYKPDFYKDILENQELELDFIPIIIYKNNPKACSDLEGQEEKIKRQDIFYNEITFDVILNATRFSINENTLGNAKKFRDNALEKFIKNRVLFLEYDPEMTETPYSTINGEFRGQNLIYNYVWNENEIFKKVGILITADKDKKAQQTMRESNAVNINSNSKIATKVKLRQIKHTELITKLLEFDKQLKINQFSTEDIDLKKINIEVKIEPNEVIAKEIGEDDDGE